MAFLFQTIDIFLIIVEPFFLKKQLFILLLIAGGPRLSLLAQPPQLSISTDLGVLRNFKGNQEFWAFGHTVQAHFHINQKDGIYAWVSYYSNGNFSNDLAALAKDSTISPQRINYRNKATMLLKHVSVGWKRYLKGTYLAENGLNIYGYAGFGLMMGKIENTPSIVVDSTNYYLTVRSGEARFKRLTLDLGLGLEWPLGADLFLYTEARTWIPTTDYPSKYLLTNDNAPLAGMFNTGIRILFD